MLLEGNQGHLLQGSPALCQVADAILKGSSEILLALQGSTVPVARCGSGVRCGRNET